ncbi:MAG TPA: response regulator [Ignavibacteriaceae bacterium]|nr:response regulator [Ignavibacteriaceae bacterium]
MPINILKAEDERIFVYDLQKSLRNLGYNILGSVHTSADALEYAIKLKPDVVILDIKLEYGSHGLEAGYKIYSAAGIPIIYLSAYNPYRYLKNKNLNYFTYLAKPVDIAFLDEEIKKIVKKNDPKAETKI